MAKEKKIEQENSIGKVYPSYFVYYNAKQKKERIKSRPVLIIAEPIGQKDTEYTVLPISTVSRSEFYNQDYDVKLSAKTLTKAAIEKDCYVRTQKRTTIYKSNIDFKKCVVDLKREYPQIYKEILQKMTAFDQMITKTARKR
jgi:uncharacterized protein YifN (PemK superfamily)